MTAKQDKMGYISRLSKATQQEEKSTKSRQKSERYAQLHISESHKTTKWKKQLLHAPASINPATSATVPYTVDYNFWNYAPK